MHASVICVCVITVNAGIIGNCLLFNTEVSCCASLGAKSVFVSMDLPTWKVLSVLYSCF